MIKLTKCFRGAFISSASLDSISNLLTHIPSVSDIECYLNSGLLWAYIAPSFKNLVLNPIQNRYVISLTIEIEHDESVAPDTLPLSDLTELEQEGLLCCKVIPGVNDD